RRGAEQQVRTWRFLRDPPTWEVVGGDHARTHSQIATWLCCRVGGGPGHGRAGTVTCGQWLCPHTSREGRIHLWRQRRQRHFAFSWQELSTEHRRHQRWNDRGGGCRFGGARLLHSQAGRYCGYLHGSVWQCRHWSGGEGYTAAKSKWCRSRIAGAGSRAGGVGVLEWDGHFASLNRLAREGQRGLPPARNDAVIHRADRMAAAVGFGSADTLRHQFRSRLNTSPTRYRFSFAA